MTDKRKIADIVDADGQPIHPRSLDKKPIIMYTIAGGEANFGYAINMLKTFRKFHDWPVILYTDQTEPEQLKRLPKNIQIEDLKPYLEDPLFYYRATPILSEPLLDEYECVVKMDADQLVLGDMSYIEETRDYDVATVINWNRIDPQFYGVVDIARLGIAPVEYFNCGLVVLRSRKFAHIWKVNCFSKQFDYMQYKEQDILNVMCYFGNWNVRCLDHPDILAEKPNKAWWGLINKGELARTRLEGKKIVLDKGEGDQPFPPEDTEIKVVHMGGGQQKGNWETMFPEEVMERINELRK